MRKTTIRAAVVAIVTFALYNMFVFLIPFKRTDAFWVSYGFTVAAYLVAALSIYVAFLKKASATSRFYGFPVAKLGVTYGLLQLVVSILVMAVGYKLEWWIPVLLYSVGLGAALIGLVCVEEVVEEIRVQDAKLKKDISQMRNLQSKVSQMASQSDNAALKTLAEDFRYSDPVSNEAVAAAEADLTAAVYELQGAFVEGNPVVLEQMCRRTSALLAERNRLCKMYKK